MNQHVSIRDTFDSAISSSDQDEDGLSVVLGEFPESGAIVKHSDALRRPVARLTLVDGRLVGIEAVPAWAYFDSAAALMNGGLALPDWHVCLFEETGALWAAHDPEMACQCRSVPRAAVTALAGEGCDYDAILRRTGAGTVCGGCRPLLRELTGSASFSSATLAVIERLDHQHARFAFAMVDGVRPDVRSGAYVFVRASVGDRTMMRAYTVTGVDAAGRVEILVKREPQGVFSRWLHDFANIDTPFEISAPQHSHDDPPGLRKAFLAAGVGITPALMEMAQNDPDDVGVHWSIRGADQSRLVAVVLDAAKSAGSCVQVHDTAIRGRVADWGRLCPPSAADRVIVCGPGDFQDTVVADLQAAGWSREHIRVEAFGQRTPAVREPKVPFSYILDPIEVASFHRAPAESVRREAESFLRQFYFEHGAPTAFEARWRDVAAEIAATGTYWQTTDELAFGACLAWRNAARCIGRFFWKSLVVRDLRHIDEPDAIFAAIVSHLEDATSRGDLQPILTVFRPGGPEIRILNPQLVLYAGYRTPEGGVIGDPKNVGLTDFLMSHGWSGRGTRFDVLPIAIQIGNGPVFLYEIPASAVLEVPLTHPRYPAFADLDLRWYAVPAVSGMALDVGGVQYSAAPSNGFFMNTEIGSVNLADPTRYNLCGPVAEVLGIEAGPNNPLWRDQAMLDLNVAVLHSFAKAGVRMLDHHALSEYFVKFREAEAAADRPSYGHWAWVMPPMGGNLSPIWRDHTLKKKILKPNYFYQPTPGTPSVGCPYSSASSSVAACPSLS